MAFIRTSRNKAYQNQQPRWPYAVDFDHPTMRGVLARIDLMTPYMPIVFGEAGTYTGVAPWAAGAGNLVYQVASSGVMAMMPTVTNPTTASSPAISTSSLPSGISDRTANYGVRCCYTLVEGYLYIATTNGTYSTTYHRGLYDWNGTEYSAGRPTVHMGQWRDSDAPANHYYTMSYTEYSGNPREGELFSHFRWWDGATDIVGCYWDDGMAVETNLWSGTLYIESDRLHTFGGDEVGLYRGGYHYLDIMGPGAVWSEHELRSFAHEYSLLSGYEEYGRRSYFMPHAGGAGVTGTAAPTESADTSVASGTVTVTGTAAPTESADTSAASGTVTITGTAAPTESADTSAASGTVTITGTAAPTESADTSAASGTVTITGTAAPTESADTSAASGTVGAGVTGTAAPTESADTSAASGTVTITGTAAPTESADTSAASGFVALAVTGTAAPLESADTLAASGAAQAALDGLGIGALDFVNALGVWFEELDTLELEIPHAEVDVGFGEAVTVAGTDYDGIFDDWSAEGDGLGGPVVRMKTADVDTAGVDQGVNVTIRNRTFEVRGVRRDGVGVATVVLYEWGT